MKNRLVLTAVAALAALLPATSMAADANYFRGKTMKIVVPYGPGGTYDQYAQAFAEHLGKHIPGEPVVIVQHMPGAGGLSAMNWAYNVMPKDGLGMITPLDNSVLSQLMTPDKVRYDARDFLWLGASNQTNIVMAVRSDSGVRTWEDLKKKEYIGSSSGQDSAYIGTNLVNGLLGTNIRVVSGYKGSAAAMHAIEQGESQLTTYNWLAWASRGHWFEGEKPFARVIVQIGAHKDPDISDEVPMLSDLVTSDADKKVVAFAASLGVLGRGLALPPGVPADIVEALRAAYDRMNADPAFAAELTKRKLRLIPSTGAEIQQIVTKAVDDTTPDVVSRAASIIYGK
ncbi:MAG: hypothetical protein WD470_02120 [Rhodospirillaceae bacterium]